MIVYLFVILGIILLAGAGGVAAAIIFGSSPDYVGAWIVGGITAVMAIAAVVVLWVAVTAEPQTCEMNLIKSTERSIEEIQRVCDEPS